MRLGEFFLALFCLRMCCLRKDHCHHHHHGGPNVIVVDNTQPNYRAPVIHQSTLMNPGGMTTSQPSQNAGQYYNNPNNQGGYQ